MVINLEAKILELEEKLKAAMLESNVGELDKLISNQLIFTDHLGNILSKEDDLAAYKNGNLKIENIELSEQIIQYFSDVVVVSVLAKITGNYKSISSQGHYRFTRIWHQEAEQWQIIAAHSSLLN